MIDGIMTAKHCVVYHFDLIQLIYLAIEAQIVMMNMHHHSINMMQIVFFIKSQKFNSYRSFSNNLNYQFCYSNYVYNNQYSQQ